MGPRRRGRSRSSEPPCATVPAMGPRFTMRARAWLATRVPELAVVAFAVALRVSLAWSYDIALGYDYPAHHQYVRYLLEHGRLPPYALNFSTYQPPLFYALAALIEKAGFSVQAVAWVSIASSCLQVLLTWLGL